MNILIADSSDLRKQLFVNVLQKQMGLDNVVACGGLDETEARLSDYFPKSKKKLDLIIFATSMAGTFLDEENTLSTAISRLRDSPAARDSARMICIEDSPAELPEGFRTTDPRFFKVTSAECQTEDSVRILVAKHTQGLFRLSLSLKNPTDRFLRAKLDSMGISAFPEGSYPILCRLVEKVCPAANSCQVAALGDGFSGASVFRLELSKNDGTSEELLLKIAPASERGKMARVHKNWPRISKELNSPLLQNTPELRLIPSKQGSLVEVHGFCAEFWQYLGGEAGMFIEWERLYQGHGATLNPNEPPNPDQVELPNREEFVAKTIRVLREGWYDASEFCGNSIALWSKRHEPDAEFDSAQPYALSEYWKTKIGAGLVELHRLGRRVRELGQPVNCDPEENWLRHRQEVEKWLEDGPAPNSVALAPLHPLVSRIHGDVNCRNVLWFKEQKRPILIDFTTFRLQGHTLQDFADMESQVIYFLMGAEESNQSFAMEWTHYHLPVWSQRQTVLVPGDLCESFVDFREVEKLNKATTPVREAEKVVRYIRSQAREIYENAPKKTSVTIGSGQFVDEYAAALLYHTIRKIGYDNSLSPFKRLLAVHASAHLIRYLNRTVGS